MPVTALKCLWNEVGLIPKMRSECVKVSSMLFDSCVNCTRLESNCVRETLREISKILQISMSTAQTLHACENRLLTGRATALQVPANQPKGGCWLPGRQGPEVRSRATRKVPETGGRRDPTVRIADDPGVDRLRSIFGHNSRSPVRIAQLARTEVLDSGNIPLPREQH